MKLTQLAAKPQLVKIELTDEDIVKEYGEPLEFWISDRQPMDKYVKLAKLGTDDMGQLINAVNEMVLDEQGQQIIRDDIMLPTGIMSKVIGKVVETLGK